MPRPLYLRRNSHSYSLKRRIDGSGGSVGQSVAVVKIKILVSAGNKTPLIQLVV
jgi:hypothetical protein